MRNVPAWRVAYFHPTRGKWHLMLYEHLDHADAMMYAAYLPALTPGVRSTLIPCTGHVTDHGADQ